MFGKLMKLYNKSSSERYIKYLRKLGIDVGEGTHFFYPNSCFVDNTRPWMIEIGKNVQFTKNISLLTHGYDWSVLKGKYGDIMGSCGKITIKDNVFIGYNTTILKNVTVGTNVIIGANSLVNKDIPDNSVAAGNPARVIMSLEDYYKRRKKEQLKELSDLIRNYYYKYKKWPEEKVLREFIFVYKERNDTSIKDRTFQEIAHLVGNYEQTLKSFYENKGLFENYEQLIDYCRKEMRLNE